MKNKKYEEHLWDQYFKYLDDEEIIKEENEMINWIKVKDRLPKNKTKQEMEEEMLECKFPFYLVIDDGEPEVAFYRNDGHWDCPNTGWLQNVTHWAEFNMPEKD